MDVIDIYLILIAATYHEHGQSLHQAHCHIIIGAHHVTLLPANVIFLDQPFGEYIFSEYENLDVSIGGQNQVCVEEKHHDQPEWMSYGELVQRFTIGLI